MLNGQNRMRTVGQRLMRSSIAIGSVFAPPINGTILNFILDVTVTLINQTRFMSFGFTEKKVFAARHRPYDRRANEIFAKSTDE